MNDKELIKKLNTLKQEIKLDSDWKQNNRDILYSQISNTSKGVEAKKGIKFIFEFLSQPAMTVASIMFLVVVTGVFGMRMADDSKPGDSLYIAKRISEKAQLAVTFDKDKKSALGLKFATNRAKDISTALTDPELAKEENKDRQTELKQEFQKEINVVKERLKEMNITSTEVAKEDVANEEVIEDEDSMVFSAGLGKAEDGMQISGSEEIVVPEEEATEEQEIVNVASSSPEVAPEPEKSPEDIVKQAEDSFNDEDYNSTVEKLDQIDAMLNDEGKVQGASEEATSTEEVE